MKVAQELYHKTDYLKSVSFGGHPIGDEGLKEILSALYRTPYLQSLSLHGTSIGVQGAKYLSIFLRKTKVASLDISNNSMADGIVQVAEALKNNSNLTQLTLSNCKIEESLPYLLENLASVESLKTLVLSSNVINEKNAEKMADFLSKNNSVETVDVSNCKMGGKALSAIFEALEDNKTLAKLAIGGNNFTAESIQALTKSLKRNSSLNSLSFCNSKLDASTIKEMGNMLSEKLHLQELDLSNAGIENDNCSVLFEPLKKSSYLKSVSFSDNPLSDARAVAELIESNRSLKRLDLGSTKIGTWDFEGKILPALKNNWYLTELSSYGLFIRSRAGEGERMMAPYLKRNAHIQTKLVMLLLRGRSECVLSKLPRRVLIHLFTFIS